MSAFPRPALSAIAFQLVGALETYQASFDRLLASRPTLDHCRALGTQLDEILLLKGALPQLSVQSVELLVCHTELMHVLWGALHPGRTARDDLVERHRDSVAAMRAKCLRLFCRSAAPA
jgi:hypothetical protein